MGGILTLLVIVYLVGIGVVLAPTVQGEWNTGTASDFFGSILQELPVAAAWPVALYHRMMDRSPGQVLSPGVCWSGLTLNLSGCEVQALQTNSYGVKPLRVLRRLAKL